MARIGDERMIDQTNEPTFLANSLMLQNRRGQQSDKELEQTLHKLPEARKPVIGVEKAGSRKASVADEPPNKPTPGSAGSGSSLEADPNPIP